MKFLSAEACPGLTNSNYNLEMAGLPLKKKTLNFCFPQLYYSWPSKFHLLFLCTFFPMAGINESASWGQCLFTAVFSSNYLETEKEVINNSGSQPETVLPHKIPDRALGQKVTFYWGLWWYFKELQRR